MTADDQSAGKAEPAETPGWRESDAGPEPRAQREKRLKIRCWRRGTREMDLLLGRFADARLARLDDAELDAFEALIREEDGALYKWLSGAEPAPDRHLAMIEAIRAVSESAAPR